MSRGDSPDPGAPTIPILMYHSVAETVSRRFQRFSVTPSLFREHCRYLRDAGFTTLTVSALADQVRRDAQSLPRPLAILTFDDGFADFHEHALDALFSHGLTATLYVVAGLVGGRSEWLRDRCEGQRLMLTWPQLREVYTAGVECGSHTQSHPQLDVLPEARARDEIAGSKENLEDGIGAPVRTFAYPFGYFNRQVRELVRAAGYESACAVRQGMSAPHDDLYALTRITITSRTNVDQLARLLAGKDLDVCPARERMSTRAWRLVRRAQLLKPYPRPSFEGGKDSASS